MKLFFLAALVFANIALAQNCSSIFTAGERGMQRFPIKGFPITSDVLPNSACGLPPQATSCVYSEAFSCLVYNKGIFTPIDCQTALAADDFPLCYGEVQFYGNCRTFECCQNLNANILPYVKQQIGSRPLGTSYYYYMQFNSPGGGVINCQSFSEGFDTCTQHLNFAGSSNWETCTEFYNQFTAAQNSDDMAFNLF